jgi:hypothetical protein
MKFDQLPLEIRIEIETIRSALIKLGVFSFKNEISAMEWQQIMSLDGVHPWLSFVMPESPSRAGLDGDLFLFIYSLEDVFWSANNMEIADVIKCKYYPIANTVSGALVLVDGNKTNLELVSLSFAAQCYDLQISMHEKIHPLGCDYKSLLEQYMRIGPSYQDEWEWRVGKGS